MEDNKRHGRLEEAKLEDVRWSCFIFLEVLLSPSLACNPNDTLSPRIASAITLEQPGNHLRVDIFPCRLLAHLDLLEIRRQHRALTLIAQMRADLCFYKEAPRFAGAGERARETSPSPAKCPHRAGSSEKHDLPWAALHPAQQLPQH